MWRAFWLFSVFELFLLSKLVANLKIELDDDDHMSALLLRDAGAGCDSFGSRYVGFLATS